MHAETTRTLLTPGQPSAPGTAMSGDGIKVESLHEIGRQLAGDDELQTVLTGIVELITAVIQCDSCFIYIVESDELALRASKNSHPDEVDRIKIKVGEGITGWVAKYRTPVAVAEQAWKDPRFRPFSELPEDKFEAFLSVPILSRGRLIGIINVQHQLAHWPTDQMVIDNRLSGWVRDRVGAPRRRGRPAFRPARNKKARRACQGYLAARTRRG